MDVNNVYEFQCLNPVYYFSAHRVIKRILTVLISVLLIQSPRAYRTALLRRAVLYALGLCISQTDIKTVSIIPILTVSEGYRVAQKKRILFRAASRAGFLL